MSPSPSRSDQKKMNLTDGKSKTTVITGNRVVISVYAESTTKFSERKTHLIRRARPTQLLERDRTGRAAGCNRREQLLGYARELRDGNRGIPSNRLPGPKQKRRWLGVPQKFRILFSQIFGKTSRKWAYERIVSDENAGDDELRNSKCIGSQRKEEEIPFRRRFKCIFGILPCGGHR